jgi:hypothetical protein
MPIGAKPIVFMTYTSLRAASQAEVRAGSNALSLRTTAHPLYTRFAGVLGASFLKERFAIESQVQVKFAEIEQECASYGDDTYVIPPDRAVDDRGRARPAMGCRVIKCRPPWARAQSQL